VTFSLAAASDGRKLPYTWNPDHQARVGLLARDGRAADVRWLEAEPCWVFHTLNAYEDDGRVVVDVVRYAGAYDVSRLSGAGPITLDRWTLSRPRHGGSARVRGRRHGRRGGVRPDE
jgi:carotenoid cleavage dioxygenase-like enzyme